ncbi:MAG TPA: hypothetical protein VN851_25190 [Thermoanaerobaculia bacterium]|nr:hypothetical protein [Thermoanaerobaculia bacterium]
MPQHLKKPFASRVPGLVVLCVLAVLIAAAPTQAAKRRGKHKHRKQELIASSSVAATGTFAKGGDSFSIADAYAYPGKGFFGGETVIKVRLTGSRLDRKALDAVLDVVGELDRQTEKDTGAVTLDVALEDAAWEGAAYRLPGGAACGYCSSRSQAAQSHLTIENGKVLGQIRTKAADEPGGEGLDIDLTLAVSIARPEGIAALPKDGGEPGKWLLGCRSAIPGADRAAIAQACGEEIAARLDGFGEQPAEEKEASLRNDLLFAFPSLALPSIAISSGRTKGDQAELVLDGTRENDKYRGSLFLRKVDGAWRIERDKIEQVWE